MSSLIKLVYLLVVLSITADFINLGGRWFNTDQDGGEIGVRSSSLFLPGADGWARIVGRVISRSAKKAAKKKAKNQARVEGNAKNKAKKTPGGSVHKKNARKSTKKKHEDGQARKARDQKRSNNNNKNQG